MRLFLIRHPMPAIEDGLCYGRSDPPLQRSVQAALMRVVPLLPPQAACYTSPLRRCRELAQALRPQVEIDDRLQEIDFGTWEMRPWNKIERSEMEAWAASPLHYAAHGGESVAQMYRRVEEFIKTLPADADHILVTHGGVMKAVMAMLLQLPEQEWLPLHFEFASVTRIDVDKGKARLVWHNSAYE